MASRYPKSGKGTKWTAKELDNINPEWKGDTLNDSEGLSGEVRVTSNNDVSIRFKYAFRWNGKVEWFQCGTYPINTLSTIRENRDFARDHVKNGIHPKDKKIVDKIEAQAAVEEVIREEEQKRTEALTFNDLYQAWIKDGVSRRDGNKYIMQSLSKHALPTLGNIEISNLSEHQLRSVYRKIIDDGKIATSVELSKDIGQMLQWGEKRKPWRALMVDGNPSELVEIKKLIPKGYSKVRKRRLSVDEIKKLKQIFDTTTQTYSEAPRKYGVERPLKKEVQIAMWLCLGTLCRIGELLMTEWKHVDFKARTWFIPAENVKGEDSAKRDQLVYLSEFTLDQFKELHTLTGHTKWAFPAQNNEGHVCVKSASKQIGDRQLEFKNRSKKLKYRVENNTLVLGDEEWTPHDLRRTGATMMQELKPRINREVINLCQNHVIGSKVDASYLLDEYADEKREAWERLGDRIQAILSAKNVVSIQSKLSA